MFAVTLYAPGQKYPEYTEEFIALNVETVATYLKGLRTKISPSTGSIDNESIEQIIKWGNDTEGTNPHPYQDNAWELYQPSIHGNTDERNRQYTGWTVTVEGSKDTDMLSLRAAAHSHASQAQHRFEEGTKPTELDIVAIAIAHPDKFDIMVQLKEEQ